MNLAIIGAVDKMHDQPLTQSEDRHLGLWSTALCMVLISLALFFVPLVNGIIAGAVGGYLAGSVRRALGAALLPAVLVALGLWILFSVIGLPVIGFFVGSSITILIALSDLGLFGGAVLGAAVHHLMKHP